MAEKLTNYDPAEDLGSDEADCDLHGGSISNQRRRLLLLDQEWA